MMTAGQRDPPQWDNHAKTISSPKRGWVSPPSTAPPLPPHGESGALEGRSFRMYDARPVSEPLNLDPNQPRAHGRVTKVAFNDVPREFERAEQLMLQGKLVEAERVLMKVLETAQSHHKARRLLEQVSMRINQQLQEQRKFVEKSVSLEDDARADRSRFYTPSMATEEYNFGPIRWGGRETIDVPLRNEGSASPPRRLVAPWLKPESVEPDERPHQRAAVDPLRPPPQHRRGGGGGGRGGGSGDRHPLAFPSHGPPPPAAAAHKFSDAEPKSPAPPSRGKIVWGAAEAEVGGGPRGGDRRPQNMWRRPATHGSPFAPPLSDSADSESQPYGRRDHLSVKVHDGLSGYDDYDDDDDGGSSLRPATRSPRRVDSASASEADFGGEVDYGRMFESKYKELKDRRAAERDRALVIREGQLHHLLNQDSIISKSMDEVHNRRHKVGTFATNKLNLSTNKGPPAALRSVQIGASQKKEKKPHSEVDRELHAASKYIIRMREAKERRPRVKGQWDNDPRFK